MKLLPISNTRRRAIDDIDQRFKRGVNKLLRMIASDNIQISYFFSKHCSSNNVDVVLPPPDNTSPGLCSSFVDCFKFCLPYVKSFKYVNTKVFRKACITAYVPRISQPCILCINWMDFWSQSLTYIQHNTLYRLIHRKVPHKACLHRLLSRPNISLLHPL